MNMIKLQRQTTDAINELENELSIVKALLTELIPLLNEFKATKLPVNPSQQVVEEEVKTPKSSSSKK